ncbi:hypothetical protein [Actinomadura sp. 9N407]|uniref:hypothetical protein n=1 Tax=Actinomadura sp. 9N407 TaxID=3375154 RepID=UPI0037948D26
MQSIIHERPDVQFLTSGPVTETERAAAERALLGALGGARGGAHAGRRGGVTSARLTLSVVADATLPRPALAQAVVEFDGRKLRAQAAAPTLTEAIDLLGTRLSLRATHVLVD